MRFGREQMDLEGGGCLSRVLQLRIHLEPGHNRMSRHLPLFMLENDASARS